MKKQIDYDDLQAQFQNQLDELQFGEHNGTSRILVVNVPDLGYGPLISHLMLGIQLGCVLGRCVVFHPLDDFNGLALFAPFSRISNTELSDSPLVKASFDVEQFESVVQFDYPEFWENHRLRKFFFPWTPLEFRELHCPRLLFDGEVQRRMTLIGELNQWLETVSAGVLNDEPTIGIYTRTSEAEEEVDAVPNELLIERAMAIAHKNNVEKTIIAGNDNIVELIESGGLDVAQIMLSESVPQPVFGLDHTLLRDILELHVLSKCDWIVGRSSASIARHAAARIGVRKCRCDRHSLVQTDSKNNGLQRIFGRQTVNGPNKAI